MKILICDNDELFTETITRVLNDILQTLSIVTEMISCRNEDEFRTLFDSYKPELVLMSVGRESVDGYRLIEEIRNKGHKFEVAFISECNEHMHEAFAYRPIGYICKPVKKDEIIKVIRSFIFYHSFNASYLFDTRLKTIHIPINDISYFESDLHHVLVHCNDESSPYRQAKRLDDIESELRKNGHRFLRIHKSFLVNMYAIKGVDSRTMRVILKNEKTLPISRKYYSATVRCFAGL